MTPEQQRIAIAEACGITGKDEWGALYKTNHGWVRDCPDYLNDLNAMHEAEKTLTNEQQFDYVYALNDVIGLVPLDSPASYREVVLWLFSQATAAQRAEAFLKTLNLWNP